MHTNRQAHIVKLAREKLATMVNSSVASTTAKKVIVAPTPELPKPVKPSASPTKASEPAQD